MKTDFFNQMKDFVLSEHKDSRNFLQYVGYYETLLQNQNVLEPLLNDLKDWRVDIQFIESKSGYGYGKYQLYLWDYDGEEPQDDDWHGYYDQKHLNYYYEILLERDERYWGYCECQPEDKGYNEKHKCCGNGCDWAAPSFTLRKIEDRRGSFEGAERNMWELEEKWNEHLESHNEKIKQEQLKRIEEDLHRLQQEKEKLNK